MTLRNIPPININLGCDGSPEALAAGKIAFELARSMAGRVEALYVVDTNLALDPNAFHPGEFGTPEPSTDAGRRLPRLEERGEVGLQHLEEIGRLLLRVTVWPVETWAEQLHLLPQGWPAGTRN